MDDDDKGFFILVLGVLAAILMIVSWWHISDGESIVDRVGGVAVAAEPEEPEPAAEEPAEDDADAFALEPADEEPTPAPEPTPEPEPTEPPLPSTVADLIADTPELSTVAALLDANGLNDVLAGQGPFTVFVPSDDGLGGADLPAGADEMLSQSPANALTYHVVEGTYTAADLVDAASDTGSTRLTSVQGEPLTISVNGDQVLINGRAAVTVTDQSADNGVVHTIDRILVPSIEAMNLIVGFEPIQFAVGSTNISEESQVTLDRIVEVLTGNDVNVTIEGHTDSDGDPILNQNLSQSRARSVLNYLVANGIEDSRLRAEGFGPTRPIADNATEEGRAQNRRIEFSLR